MNPLPFPRLALRFADRVTDRFTGRCAGLLAGLVAGLASACLAPHCLAEEPPGSDVPSRPSVDVEVGPRPPGPVSAFVLGTSLTSAAEYSGSGRRDLSWRPLLAYRYGRFKLSSSGSSALLNFGSVADESGASLDLLESSRLTLRTGLRIGGGRDTSDSVDLAGLPDIRKTVFARLSASYRLTGNWRADSTLGWDLLGRGNGVFLSAGLGYRLRLTPGTEFAAAAGLNVGNATHMNSFFGVPVSAQTADRPAYRPGAGLKDAGVGIGLTTILPHGWIAFGNLGYSRLLAGAADSPLTTRAASPAVTIGIAWRCCK